MGLRDRIKRLERASEGDMVFVPQPDAPLTRERIEAMSPDEINEPSMWERVQRFMAGERA